MSGAPPGPSASNADGTPPGEASPARFMQEDAAEEASPSSLQPPTATAPSSTANGGDQDDGEAPLPYNALPPGPEPGSVPTAAHAPSSTAAAGPASATAGAPGAAAERLPPPPPPAPTAAVVLDLPPGNVTVVRTAEELLEVPPPPACTAVASNFSLEWRRLCSCSISL